MHGTLPLHAQLENLIKDKILNGDYAMDTLLPSERKMAETYGINRLTVRAALKNLQNEGLVSTIHGKGNYVRSVKMKVSFSAIRGFGAQLKDQGVAHINKVLSAGKTPANYDLSKCFGVEKGTPLFRLTRARYGNGSPIAIDDTYFLYDAVRDVENIDFAVNSLYQTFDENGITLSTAQQILSIYTLHGENASVLDLPEGAAVFCINHQVCGEDGRLVEYTLSYINPAMASITSYLK